MAENDAVTRIVEPSEREHGGFETAEVLSPGTEFQGYTIERTLGLGGCGIVYAARRGDEASFAVKVLYLEMVQSSEMLERFELETQAIGRIAHPNIVAVHGFGKLADGRPYYVMDRVAGTLRDRLRERGRFSPVEAEGVLASVCAAVQAAHDAGFVHRDIKASNIGLGLDGDPASVKLLDFGIAKLLNVQPGAITMTTMGRRLGTPTAMAPEQIAGIVIDARTDVYALGVLLYELLTGMLPFRSEDPVELEALHCNAPVPRPSRLAPIPPSLDDVVLRAMQKAPEQRYPSARAFLEGLQQAIGQAVAVSTERNALAVYVEVREDGEVDDAALEQIGSALDDVDQLLTRAGLGQAHRTWSALLAVRLLGDDGGDDDRLRAELGGLVDALVRTLEERGLRGGVCVHVGRATLDGASAEVGGPILSPAGWVPEGMTGTHITPDALQQGFAAGRR
jgi:serine/threonine-protein kinase